MQRASLAPSYAVRLVLVITALLALADAERCELRRVELYGHIQSENGDYDNYHNQCWLLQPPLATKITLSFQQFSTEQGYDKLHVYDGNTTDAAELTPSEGLSGSALPAPITSSGGALLVLFVSDSSYHAPGFTFAWTSMLDSPLPDGWCATGCDPSKRNDDVCNEACFNAACNWEGGACTQLCNATSGCRWSQMNDGNCDPECYNEGCSFDSHDCECGTSISAAYGFARDTPNRSVTVDYDNNVHRCWLIEAQPGQRLSLSFERFDVEARFDRLRIYDGRSAVALPLHEGWGLSGLYDNDAVARLRFNSSGDALLIYFDSDSSITESGFVFGWTPLTPPAGLCALDCTEEKRQDAACDLACMNEQCGWDSACWLIRPKQPNVTSLTLSFARFDIEHTFDQLRIYDGPVSRDDALLAVVSGTDLPRTFHSSSTPAALLLKFHSDYSNTENGFLFSWTSEVRGRPLPAGECAHGCTTDSMVADGMCHPQCMNDACGFDGARLGDGGWHGGDCSGTCYEGPDEVCHVAQLGDGKCDQECLREECNFDYRDCECNDVLTERAGFHAHGGAQADYENNERLCWLIRPKAGAAKISLSFRRFDVEERWDGLKIFDGVNVYSPLLLDASGEKHGDALKATFVESTGGSLLVTFESDYAVTESGFLFGWTSELASEPRRTADACAFNCTEVMRGDGACDFSCMNAECEWDAAPGEARGDCDVECSVGCTLDMLDNEACDKSCTVPACNFDYRDCECANVLDTCDGSYTDGSGPHAPYNLDVSRCWLIRPKRDGGVLSRLTLHWDRFDTEEYFDLVKVYDGRSELDKPLHTGNGWSGKATPPDVTSSGGEMLIRFTTDHSRSAAGFAFSWSCTGLIDLGAGETPGFSPNLLLNPHMLKWDNAALRGWNITQDGGHQVVERVPLQPCCSLTPERGGALLATSSSGWLVREQELDLVALGFASTYLDTAPAVHVTERFSQLPPSGDPYFLWVQLLGADREPITAGWGRDGPGSSWSFAETGSHQCSAITCQLADEESVWTTQSHDFVGYGSGLRYVLWRDGGRGEGGVLASPSLTLATAPPSSCTLKCVHGACGPGGGCLCDSGWEGELCNVHMRTARPAVCGLDCSGHGTCIFAERTAQRFDFCRCEAEYVGTYCTGQTDGVAGPSCASAQAGGSPSAYRRGIFASVGAPYTVSSQVVSDGLVVSKWRGGGTAPPELGVARGARGNVTSLYAWLVDDDALEPVQLGAPQLWLGDATALSAKVKLVTQQLSGLEFLALVEERDDRRLRLAHGGEPLQLHVEYECHAEGEATVELTLPVSGYCPLVLAWRHRCNAEDMAGSWLPWLALLGCSACLGFACLRRRQCTHRRLGELLGAAQGTGMLRPAEEVQMGWLQKAKYGAYLARSRLRLARDDMSSGGGLIGAMTVLLQGSSDHQRVSVHDSNEML